jgi:hypothetical protein
MNPKWTNLLLGAGALFGALLAARGLVEARPKRALPSDAVAVVNGRAISRAEYRTALAAVAADRRAGVDDAEIRRHVLDRLIDEELLVQAGLELGLAERDRRVRADLATAAIGFVADAPDEREPSAAELAAFYAEHAGYFARDATLALERAFFAGPSARERADAAAARLAAGAAFSELASAADPPLLPLPSSELPLAKLEQYLGPETARALAELEPGAVSPPLATSGGFVLYRVVSKHAGVAPPLAQVESEVRSEWRRRKSESRMQSFLDERRGRAELMVDPELAR